MFRKDLGNSSPPDLPDQKGYPCRLLMKKILICILAFVLVSSAFGKLEITDIDFTKFPEVNVHVVEQIDIIDPPPSVGEVIEFTLTENGRVIQELKSHLQSPIPKVTVLTFDVSKSIDLAMFARGKQIANVFVESKSPADFIAITRFGERSEVVSEFSQEKDVLFNAISDLKIESGKTALNDAIYDSLTLLSRDIPLRRDAISFVSTKCVIVFSDGKEENSALILEDSIDLAIQSKVKVHTVCLASSSATVSVGTKTLIRISKLTSGKHFQTTALEDKSIYQEPFGFPKQEFILTLTYKSYVKRGSEQKKIQLAMQAQIDDTIETATKEFQIEPIENVGVEWKTVIYVSASIVGLLLIGFVGLSIYQKQKRICQICGREMLPEWAECQFCAKDADHVRPERSSRQRGTACLISSDGVEHNLINNTLIGRAQGNDIVLSHLSVSRQHALIKSEHGKHRIFSLGAKNGIMINDHVLSEPQQLYDEDEIKLGEVSLFFRCVNSEKKSYGT